jgi:hypothetical protein
MKLDTDHRISITVMTEGGPVEVADARPIGHGLAVHLTHDRPRGWVVSDVATGHTVSLDRAMRADTAIERAEDRPRRAAAHACMSVDALLDQLRADVRANGTGVG